MSTISKSTAAEGQWMGGKTELDLDALRRDFEEDFTPTTIGGVEWMRRGRNGGYRNPSTQSAWQGYVACAARRATIQPTAAEPVAAVVGRVNDALGNTTLRIGWLRPENCEVGSELYTAPVAPADAVRDARNEALEDAATECERVKMFPGGRQECEVHGSVWSAAAAIRALKSTPKEPAK